MKIGDREFKPSEIVRLMVRGLRNPRNIQVDMRVYGCEEDGVCFGCAATCALQEVFDITFVPNTIGRKERYKLLPCEKSEIAHFEFYINNLRMGYPYDILSEEEIRFLGKRQFYLPCLTSSNYLDKLHEYENFAKFLEEKGM